MKNLLKFIKWTVILFPSIPAVFYLAWLTGNLKNDELNPELAMLLAHRPPEINEQNNAYFDTIGMNAPPNMEAHAWGVSWFAQASVKDKALLAGAAPTPSKLENKPSNPEKVDLSVGSK